jgi:DNA-binding NtrC family response regulator
VAATNRDLEGEVAEGRFREDLFYRLNVFPVVLPPLRERPGDLEPLVHHFLAKAGSPPDKITPEGYRALAAYPFPGNVRELAHVIERALSSAGPEPVTPDELLFQPARRGGMGAALGGALAGAAAAQSGEAGAAAARFAAVGFLEGGFAVPEIPEDGLSLEALERALVLQALEKAKGNKSRAARLLGLTRRTLYSRLEKHGLHVPGEGGEGAGTADTSEAAEAGEAGPGATGERP